MRRQWLYAAAGATGFALKLVMICRVGSSSAGAMENKTMRFTLLLVVALLGGAVRLAAQEAVEARGITSEIKIEEVLFGHLTELNDKFKLRATEFTFAPGAYLGAHHHVGPGIRYVLSGELTFTEGGQETVYKAGEYFFETGNVVHTAQNKTTVPLRVLIVEILPKNWTAPAVIAPKSR
jgi:quercetin dioxygenase-like cupin family protein